MLENKPKKELTDNELVEIVRNEDSERYGELIERYQGKLFAYLYRLTGNRDETEDLLQDVFIKAYRNLHSYDISRKFSSWIYRIAHNEAVNHIKRRSLKRFIPWEDITATKDMLVMSSLAEGADVTQMREETRVEVDEAINRLPFKYKQVLTLRYYSDKSYEDISEILGKPINTVGTLISRAKKKMAAEIEKNNQANLSKGKKI